MSSIHVHGEALAKANDAQEMTKYRKSHKVTKPLLGGRSPNRPRLVDGHTVAVLAGIMGLSLKDFVEAYSD